MDHPPSPVLLQKGDSSRTPLFLLHDAGGTIFNYYKLGNVGRPIYAISNPWIKAETKWEGGAMRFVHEYIKLIKSVVSSGEILVGGWSLGGQLGIDIGRVLASNPRSRLCVVGVVMIDTLYPYWGPAETPHAEFPVDLVLRNCPDDLRAEMIRCMQWSKQDSDEWVQRNWKDNADELDEIEAEEPPPGVLILAKGYVPVGEGQAQGGDDGKRVMVDYLREKKAGWDLFPHQFIAAVWEVGGHHFGLFEKDTIQATTEKVRRACDLLADD